MATKSKKPTTTKKTRATTTRVATKSANTSTTSQFAPMMVTAFTVLSVVFLFVVIQNYL